MAPMSICASGDGSAFIFDLHHGEQHCQIANRELRWNSVLEMFPNLIPRELMLSGNDNNMVFNFGNVSKFGSIPENEFQLIEQNSYSG